MNIRRLTLWWIVMPIRLRMAFGACRERLYLVVRWLFTSREHTNLTYDLTELNRRHLAHFLSIVCDQSVETINGYLEEVLGDKELYEHVVTHTRESSRNYLADDSPRFGRRIGWYAIVRAIKPAVVVETGVDKGLGSCVLTAALMKNAAEGNPGMYYGTDINPKAGYLLQAPYDQYGKILYGDSLESIKKIDSIVDLFINDSDHSLEYEQREFDTVAPKLSEDSIVIGDNSHFSEKLVDFAEKTNREFLYFQEHPKDFWQRGAGIGAAYSRRK
jgi:predicted O-methyltransferase YrrM